MFIFIELNKNIPANVQVGDIISQENMRLLFENKAIALHIDGLPTSYKLEVDLVKAIRRYDIEFTDTTAIISTALDDINPELPNDDDDDDFDVMMVGSM